MEHFLFWLKNFLLNIIFVWTIPEEYWEGRKAVWAFSMFVNIMIMIFIVKTLLVIGNLLGVILKNMIKITILKSKKKLKKLKLAYKKAKFYKVLIPCIYVPLFLFTEMMMRIYSKLMNLR